MSDQIIQKDSRLKFYLLFLKKKPHFIILIIFIPILLTLTFMLNNLRIDKLNLKISENFNQANIFISNNKNEEAKKILIDIINKKHKFYAPLALNTIIEKKLSTNKIELDKYFDKIILIKQKDKEINNLVRLKKGLFLLSDVNSSESSILDTLNPIINNNSIWKNTAIKLLVNYYTYLGEDVKSKEYYDLLNNK
tara:strand:+ start:2775 stop:3356 length:582 start_codon:yes stop_codon:yes gene_type:complete